MTDQHPAAPSDIPTADTPADPHADIYRPFNDDPTAALVFQTHRRQQPLQVWEHTRAHPDGHTFPHWRVTHAGGRPGVAVLPVTDDGRIGLLRIWRPVVSAWVWEIPRGGADTDDPIADARRELAEETGLHATDLIHAGHIDRDSGFWDVPVNLVIARVHDAPADPDAIAQGDDQFEIREFRLVPRRVLNQMIVRGEVTDAFTLCALAFLDATL